MKEYLISLLFVASAAAITQAIMRSSALKNHIAFLCSMCALAVVIMPLGRFITELDDAENIADKLLSGEEENFENYDDIYNSYLIEGGETLLEKRLRLELADTLGVKGDALEVEASLSYSETGAYAEGIEVYLYPQAYSCDPKVIKELIYDRLFVECEIIYY